VIQNQIAAYRSCFLEHGSTPQGTRQNNKETQRERFEQLIKPLMANMSGQFSVCDVGAGVADFHHFLLNKEIPHSYTGVEIVQEMIDAVHADNPEIRILNRDILEEGFDEEFDFLVANGVFNFPGQTSVEEWESFVFSMIEKMYRLARVGVSFNALTTYSTFQDLDLYYLDPSVVLEFVQRSLGRHCEIRMSSPLFEVTYTVFKPESIKRRYPQAEFQKYHAR